MYNLEAEVGLYNNQESVELVSALTLLCLQPQTGVCSADCLHFSLACVSCYYYYWLNLQKLFTVFCADVCSVPVLVVCSAAMDSGCLGASGELQIELPHILDFGAQT